MSGILQVILILILAVQSGMAEAELGREEEVRETYTESGCYDYPADYDGDGAEEEFRWVGNSIRYRDEDGKEVLVDYMEPGWGIVEDAIVDYNGIMVLRLYLEYFGSTGWGNYLGTTYLYDGSIRETEDKEFLDILRNDKGWECDINGDGQADLFREDEAVYEKTPEGIVCRFQWIEPEESDYYRGLVLQEDGSLLAYYENFGTAYEAWIQEIYTFDREWKVKKETYVDFYFDAEDLEEAGEEERKFLREKYFPDTELETLKSGHYELHFVTE